MTQPATEAPAPFFAEGADAPPQSHAVWRLAADGVRLRLGSYGTGPRGTVLCFQGRTEYLEKYGPLARDLAAAGFGMVGVDWRGQGLSARLAPDPRLGHIGRFADYQMDVAALVAFAAEAGHAGPFHLLCHSMGGAIGLRALAGGLAVTSATFSAPMWGLTLSPPLRALSRLVPPLAEALGLGHRKAPGTGFRSYILDADPADNLLTTDAAALRGPTLHWLHEALTECRRLETIALPDVPTLVFLGGHERIVDPGVIRRQAARWPSARLVELEAAEHEVLMERPAIRSGILADLTGLIATS